MHLNIWQFNSLNAKVNKTKNAKLKEQKNSKEERKMKHHTRDYISCRESISSLISSKAWESRWRATYLEEIWGWGKEKKLVANHPSMLIMPLLKHGRPWFSFWTSKFKANRTSCGNLTNWDFRQNQVLFIPVFISF